nr:60 kDa SS-A/Ro ribonucleoprotein-like [Leptinotarsa decemlineata]
MAASRLSNQEKLKRLIYVGNLTPKYFCGGPEKYYPDTERKMELINEMLASNHEDFLKVIVSASEDKLLPYRSQLFNLLGAALNAEAATADIKHEICSYVLNICKSDEDFFNFIKFTSSVRLDKSKLSTTVRKLIARYYIKKSALELAHSFVACKSWHGWTHKDLIKLVHIKPDTPLKNMVINYILLKKLNDKDNEDEKKIIDIMQKSEILRKTKDHKVAVPLISELKATINQVEPSLRKSAEVWNSVLLNMTISDILQALPKLYKLGFLKKDAPTQTIVNENLTNSLKIKASHIHPIEVFIHMKNFEKGGKPLDPKLLEHLIAEKKLSEEEIQKLKSPREAKCPLVLNNLQKCMNIACSNVQSFGKRYLITIDTTDHMDTPCLFNKNITAIEAAVAFAWFLLRVEKDVTVAVFKEKEIAVVQLDKKGHLYEHVQKLRENKSKYVLLAAPIEWATFQKKHVDIFLTFIHHKDFYAAIPKEIREKMTKPEHALQKYRKKVNLQNSKLINFCLSSPNVVCGDGSPNILDVAGLDYGTPRAVEAFCRGNFC